MDDKLNFSHLKLKNWDPAVNIVLGTKSKKVFGDLENPGVSKFSMDLQAMLTMLTLFIEIFLFH